MKIGTSECWSPDIDVFPFIAVYIHTLLQREPELPTLPSLPPSFSAVYLIIRILNTRKFSWTTRH